MTSAVRSRFPSVAPDSTKIGTENVGRSVGGKYVPPGREMEDGIGQVWVGTRPEVVEENELGEVWLSGPRHVETQLCEVIPDVNQGVLGRSHLGLQLAAVELLQLDEQPTGGFHVFLRELILEVAWKTGQTSECVAQEGYARRLVFMFLPPVGPGGPVHRLARRGLNGTQEREFHGVDVFDAIQHERRQLTESGGPAIVLDSGGNVAKVLRELREPDSLNSIAALKVVERVLRFPLQKNNVGCARPAAVGE